ncbi:MAG: hypothetical protein H7Z21_05165 [Hymenobacter sp.]|nr:hypothetical protein [Hymenobacter sp.]
MSLALFTEEAELLDWRHALSVFAFLAASIYLYFVSRTRKERVAPLVLVLIPPALASGVLLCVAQFVHYLPIAGIGAVLLLSPLFFFALFVLPAFALGPATVLLATQLYIQTTYNLRQAAESTSLHPVLNRLHRFYFGPTNGVAHLLAFPFFVTIGQTVLLLAAQQPDSLLQAFLQSHDGLFSQGLCEQCVSMPNTEYICTIAGFGSRGLVKPLRWGHRHGHLIRVTRQLQVCNAFEELLSERLPWLQRVLRRGYDGMQIPVEKWKHVRAVANGLYVVIKPIEWGFLLALYCFDSRPESRISRQYLPAGFSETGPGSAKGIVPSEANQLGYAP